MERVHEEKRDTQESSRSGAWPIRRARAQRSQTARQSRERAQGWPGQKPEEDASGAAQCATASTRPSQEVLKNLVAMIRARFGDVAIGLGEGGIRYRVVVIR